MSQATEGPLVPAVGDPEVALPEPSVPEPTAVVPEAWDPRMPRVARRSAGDLPEQGPELVDRRDARTEVFANADGTETVKLYGGPVHYQPDGTSSWEKIDNRIVADESRPGWLRNAGNDWTVRFGPIAPVGAGGVELTTDAGVARYAPELPAGAAAPVLPVVGTGADTDAVTYRGVWPGVDVVYTVSNSQVREDIVVADGAQAEYPFVVEGLGLTAPAPGSGVGAEVLLAVPPGGEAPQA
ncbi:MAG TPA: hypothetical protein VFI47_13655, partial [Acidimicrobiales bacterium]|nr:hypothetical protein [Acidimicrobiales bacterium]